MQRRLALLSLLLPVLLAVGCQPAAQQAAPTPSAASATPTASAEATTAPDATLGMYDTVQLRWTQQQVIDAIGQPRTKSSYGKRPTSVLTYGTGKHQFHAIVQGGVVVGKDVIGPDAKQGGAVDYLEHAYVPGFSW